MWDFFHVLNNQPGYEIYRTLHQVQCWEWRLYEEYKFRDLFNLSAYYGSHHLGKKQTRGSPSLLCMGYHHERRIFWPTILTIYFYCNLNKINSKCLLAGTALSNMKTNMLDDYSCWSLVQIQSYFRRHWKLQVVPSFSPARKITWIKVWVRWQVLCHWCPSPVLSHLCP